jgi:hypothetical protein
MNTIIRWLETLERQLNKQDAPMNCVIEMPTDKETFMHDIKGDWWLLCWGEDKEGFDGIVLRCNGRKYFILEAKIDY